MLSLVDDKTQLIPFEEYIALDPIVVLSSATATKIPNSEDQHTLLQLSRLVARKVQFIPLEDVITLSLPTTEDETATKSDSSRAQHTLFQLEFAGDVLEVHIIPSDEVIIIFPTVLDETATKSISSEAQQIEDHALDNAFLKFHVETALTPLEYGFNAG